MYPRIRACQCFEEKRHFHLQWLKIHAPLRTMVPCPFETFGSTCTGPQCHIPGDQNPPSPPRKSQIANTIKFLCLCRGRDSSVGIAIRYWLDDPGIESRWGAKFSALVHTGYRTHPASYTMDTGSFPGIKWPGRGANHPPHLAPRLKKEYIYTTTPPLSVLSSPILGRSLPFLPLSLYVSAS